MISVLISVGTAGLEKSLKMSKQYSDFSRHWLKNQNIVSQPGERSKHRCSCPHESSSCDGSQTFQTSYGHFTKTMQGKRMWILAQELAQQYCALPVISFNLSSSLEETTRAPSIPHRRANT